MISTTYKDDALAFINSVATQKINRMNDLNQCKQAVMTMLNGFRKKQMDMHKSIMHDANQLHQSLATGEAQRQHSFEMFCNELTKEGQKRTKATKHRVEQVGHLRECFQRELGVLKSEIQNKAHELHTKLQHGEKARMGEFKRFEQTLAAEKKERIGNDKQMKAQVREFLTHCRTKQQHIKNGLGQQFSFARTARQEIQRSWAAVANIGGMQVAHIPNFIQPTHATAQHTFEMSTDESGSLPAHKSTNRKPTLYEKVKATLAGSSDGFRFSEILRSLGDIGKPELRDALTELMTEREILKDDHDRYHLV